MYNKGILALSTCKVSGNQAGEGESGPQSVGGDGGSGGGLYNYNGEVTISNSTFSGNQAGTSGDGCYGGLSGSGGGLFNNEGIVIVDNSTFRGNQAGTGRERDISECFGDDGGSGGQILGPLRVFVSAIGKTSKPLSYISTFQG